MLVVVMCIVFGFVASGVLTSCYDMIFGAAPDFQITSGSRFAAIAYMMFIVLSGPVILAAGALKELQDGDLGHFSLSAHIALIAGWSFILGVLILSPIMSLQV